MILLFLGSWRATLIIAVSIPLAVLTSLIALAALGQTINIMTLGGLALAVGILVDDATVAIENITHHLEKGEPLHDAILNGSGEIAVPTFVSTLSICIVFVPMFLLSGVARYLFVPMAEAVVFAMCASYFFSRTLIPTLAMYLMRAPSKASGSARRPHERVRPFPGTLRASLRSAAQSLSRHSSACDREAPALSPDLSSALSRFARADPVRGPRLLSRCRYGRNSPASARPDRHAHRGNRAPDRSGRSEDSHGDSEGRAGCRARQHRRAGERHQPDV